MKAVTKSAAVANKREILTLLVSLLVIFSISLTSSLSGVALPSSPVCEDSSATLVVSLRGPEEELLTDKISSSVCVKPDTALDFPMLFSFFFFGRSISERNILCEVVREDIYLCEEVKARASSLQKKKVRYYCRWVYFFLCG